VIPFSSPASTSTIENKIEIKLKFFFKHCHDQDIKIYFHTSNDAYVFDNIDNFKTHLGSQWVALRSCISACARCLANFLFPKTLRCLKYWLQTVTYNMYIYKNVRQWINLKINKLISRLKFIGRLQLMKHMIIKGPGAK
jgi:hypothetical protein